MRHQKLLKQPRRLLLAAVLATASTTVPLRTDASTDSKSSGTSGGHHHAITNGKMRTRQELYQTKGIERWGINE